MANCSALGLQVTIYATDYVTFANCFEIEEIQRLYFIILYIYICIYIYANRHQAGTTPRYHVYSISPPPAKGINPVVPLAQGFHNCISPWKEFHVAALTRCTAIDQQLTNIIRQYRQYPSDNLGFTGYQPYRPPTEPYERACGNLLRDGWRG